MGERERHRGYSASGRLSAHNPNRLSMPNSLYYEDAYLAPPSSGHHPVTAPTGYSTSTSNGAPTTTRTYSVSQHPRSHSHTRDQSRNRRSTLDSASRPPVVVTTMQKERPHIGSRNESPVRDDYRYNDYYAQPASSIHSRNSSRQYNDEHTRYRPRDRTNAPSNSREADAYRSTRPTVAYPSDPRHSNAAIDYGDDGYKYTNAGELVRYDLDHPGPSHRRHDSFDRPYHNSQPGYLGDPRRDSSRSSYLVAGGRKYENRGPPPSTRGFDKVNRRHDSSRERDRDRDLLPAAPPPPNPKLASTSQVSDDRRDSRYSRSVSVNQEVVPFEDEQLRGNEAERRYRNHGMDHVPHSKHSRYYDDSVSSRGFGIRTDPSEEKSDRHNRHQGHWKDSTRRDGEHFRRGESREDFRRPEATRDAVDGENLRRRDDLERRGVGGRDTYGHKDEVSAERPVASQHDQSERKAHSDSQAASRIADYGGDENKPATDHDTRDSMTGLGITAAAAATAGIGRHSDSKSSERETAQQQSSVGNREREHIPPSKRQDPLQSVQGRKTLVDQDHDSAEDRFRKDAGEPTSDKAISDSDENRKAHRRPMSSKGFNPNDTGELMQLKDEFAALEISERGDNSAGGGALVRVDSLQHSDDEVDDHTRGHDIVLPASDRRVRVVSPPRDRKDDKPRKGILKQPKVSFPEEANPVREGVAPHREDKKFKDVPPGARWTKINRKVVNPEALTIGKERFEERDDFVIVLRVLDKEEIQAYAAATQVLRERRRNRDQGALEAESKDREQDEDGYEHDSAVSGRRYYNGGDDELDEAAPPREKSEDTDRRRRGRGAGVEVEEEDYEGRARGRDHHRHRRHDGHQPDRFVERERGSDRKRDADL